MFYDVFLKLCKEKNISPTRAALEIGLSKSTPTTWKKRNLTPRGEILNKIADYFGVPVDYLLGNKEKSPATSEGLTFDNFTYALLDESKELTDENKDKLLEMAKFFKMQQDKEKQRKE